MRKENLITLQDGGEAKQFKIRQMPATQGERFLLKLLMALGAKANTVSMDDPMQVINAVCSQPFEKVQDLLDDMISCISRVHDGGIETQLTPDNADDFIEDVPTLLRLRAEAVKVNNFFQKVGEMLSDSSSGDAVMIKRKT